MDEATPRLVFGDQLPTLNRYVDILASRGIDWGLIGPREADRLWQRHILNSIAIAPLIPEGASVVDVGSGAGLPGVPLAILRPDLRVVLLEPLLRRSEFLNLVVDELELAPRVSVVRGRAEDHAGRYDAVVSRAVAPLPRLLAWCLPLMAPSGTIIALKGSSAADEVAAAGRELKRGRVVAEVHEVAVPGVDEPTWAIIISARRQGMTR